MKFIADLHIHSKYSRATAKNSDIENFYITAQKKGVRLLATGDFTHPAWFAEIKEKLQPAEPGLFKLKKDIAKHCDKLVPARCRGDVRFMLATEISNIYKKEGKTRKNHNLIFLPDFEAVQQFNERLEDIGNTRSDGRPILGLDAKHLLDIVLETAHQGFLVPAHIWTPWFSVLGSRSGFDSIEACFEDLTPYVKALETGLSSDPPMNWRISSLDGFTLISNSDAHSPAKIGREANLFDTELDYHAIKAAIERGASKGFLGTIEFFPEEGKYHFDGHRKCGVRADPRQGKYPEGLCSVCEKPLTLGVLNRVETLADRAADQTVKGGRFISTVSLSDALSEILAVGPNSKTVAGAYRKLLTRLGPELDILLWKPIEEIETAGMPLLSEALKRIRGGRIHVEPGYDGEYGIVRVFGKEERRRLTRQCALFLEDKKKNIEKPANRSTVSSKKFEPEPIRIENEGTKAIMADEPIKSALNREQRRAVEVPIGPVLVVAGPGTGKTRCLTYRIAWMIRNERIPPSEILALTFTNAAAGEMSERLTGLLGDGIEKPVIATFHSICYRLLQEMDRAAGVATRGIIDERERRFYISSIRDSMAETTPSSLSKSECSDALTAAKQLLLGPDDELDGLVPTQSMEEFRTFYRRYQQLITFQGLVDFDDLIYRVVRRIEADDAYRETCRKRFVHVLIDEYQDINDAQYRLIRALCPSGASLYAIGDPDQAIYGFRGCDTRYFSRFAVDYPESVEISLLQNYRSTEAILEAAYQLIRSKDPIQGHRRIYSGIDGVKTIRIFESETEKSEAVSIGLEIEKLVGGTGFHSMDFGAANDLNDRDPMAFCDIAVLYRTRGQAEAIAGVFEKAGIPHLIASRKHLYEMPGIAEMVSMMKILQERGSLADLYAVANRVPPGVSAKTCRVFSDWWMKSGLTQMTAMKKAERFPIPGMNRRNQTNLVVFFKRISDMKEQIRGLSVEKALIYLTEHMDLRKSETENSGFQRAADRILSMARSYGGDIVGFLGDICLQTDADAYDPRGQHVSLMTMHAAKGLEFSAVFVSGCEDGLIPHFKDAADVNDIDEERRLFFVAMTRAKKRLYLTHAKNRRHHGIVQHRRPTPFLRDIESDLLTRESGPSSLKNTRPQRQLNLF